MADLHSKILDARPPWGSKFFQFHAVFGKIWQNCMLAPPLESWRPLLGEILDPPLKGSLNIFEKDVIMLFANILFTCVMLGEVRSKADYKDAAL